MKAKVGDTVHVRAVVQRTGDTWVEALIRGEDISVVVLMDNIVHVEPRKLAVGDRVIVPGDGHPGVIRAIECDEAWIHWVGDGYRTTHKLKNLALVAS